MPVSPAPQSLVEMRDTGFPRGGSAPLEIGTARIEDISLLQQLADETWRASYAHMLTLAQIDYMLAWMYGAETIAAELAGGVVWRIARAEKEPVGYYSWRLDADDARVNLNKLYVLPARQRQGFGRAMLEHALRGAGASGAREMSLNVNKQNARAQRLYAHAGFRITGEVVFEIGAGFVMDDFVMTRGLAQ